MDISLVEYGVNTFPKGLEGWRMYRIEYGGHAEACLAEGLIWLPKYISAERIEELLEAWSVGKTVITNIVEAVPGAKEVT
jgi:hypothetical protein